MKQTLTLVTAIALIFAACTQNHSNSNLNSSVISEANKSIQQISSVLPDIKKEPSIFKINVAEAQELTTETGSIISIPANAFTDAEGNPITGEVEISFEEFHDATDVILSGIPMNYESEDGKMEFFETAGMFNIKGEQNGKAIHIAKDKAIDIELATYKPEEDYNFYEFEEDKGEWKEKAPAEDIEVRRNRARQAFVNTQLPEIAAPVEVKKAESTDFVFELAIDKTENPEFEVFDNVLWRLKDQDPAQGELFKSRVRQPTLTMVDEANSTFRLTGFAGTQPVEAVVEPVLFGSKWQETQKRFKARMAEFNKRKEERAEQAKRLDKMADLSRQLSVQKFGIYNCDRTSIWKGKKSFRFNALYLLPALNKSIKQAVLIIKNKKNRKIAIPLNEHYSKFFTFSPEDNNTLISFDDEGNLYEFRNEDFDMVAARKPKHDEEFTFKLEKTGYKITSERDLTDYLDQL